MIKNQCHLITYPDSLGTNLEELRYVLDTYLSEAVGGVHILPFYPSSADRGYAPLTYFEIDSRFGTWDDIRAISSRYDLVVDLVVNHISRKSAYFEDFIKHKDGSRYADLFIRLKNYWPGGEFSSRDLQTIYTRKPSPPYTEVTFQDGSREKLWCTFDRQQIDMNLTSSTTREFLKDVISFLASQGTRMIRLDAIGYTTKKPGTNCFFVEPDIWEFLSFIERHVAPLHVEMLPEVHEHYTLQQKLADRGYWAYDFALPMLILQAVYDGNAENLKRWLHICPRQQITTLDTHDGIGVVDVFDLMTEEEIKRTKNNVFEQGANVKKIFNTPQYNNLDIYQINCTYYSALGNNDQAYLLARAVQCFSPGIPQIYYVGLLAGKNDIELVEKTKTGRDINRHYYSLQDIEEQMSRPVVQQLLSLMRFRNTHPAFSGSFSLHDSRQDTLRIRWDNGSAFAELHADFDKRSFTISYTDSESTSPKVFMRIT